MNLTNAIITVIVLGVAAYLVKNFLLSESVRIFANEYYIITLWQPNHEK